MQDNYEDDDSEYCEAVQEWWKENASKQFATILNPQAYNQVKKTIQKIIQVAQQQCDEEEMPTFKLEYDRLFGTKLALRVKLSVFGIDLVAKQIREIFDIMPDDALLAIMPTTDSRALIEITFQNVKIML